jgi:hypothetical protein
MNLSLWSLFGAAVVGSLTAQMATYNKRRQMELIANKSVENYNSIAAYYSDLIDDYDNIAKKYAPPELKETFNSYAKDQRRYVLAHQSIANDLNTRFIITRWSKINKLEDPVYVNPLPPPKPEN